MSAVVLEPVRRALVVNVPVERAFAVFTGEQSRWWPLDTHHIGEQDAEAAVLEPRAGGRWFERAADGTECEWGRVLVWEPPARVVLAWHLNADWQFDPNPSAASEIEVTFAPEGDGATRVELVHRNIERHARAEDIRAAVDSDGGWNGLLERFREAAEE
jgi:uncharacterized protein YndB with AHSA1/START domain